MQMLPDVESRTRQQRGADEQQRAVDLAEMFKLLGDPNRVRILLTLSDVEEMCVHEIAETVNTTDTKVSQALRLLRTAGIVANRRDGRHIHYRLDDEHVRNLLVTAVEHSAHQPGR